MRNPYRVGPVYRASLIVSGSMCAGLGIAILAAPALRGIARTEVFPASAATPPVAALGFAACGLALIAIGLWFPRVASVLAMVTLSMAVVRTCPGIVSRPPAVYSPPLCVLLCPFQRLKCQWFRHPGRFD